MAFSKSLSNTMKRLNSSLTDINPSIPLRHLQKKRFYNNSNINSVCNSGNISSPSVSPNINTFTNTALSNDNKRFNIISSSCINESNCNSSGRYFNDSDNNNNDDVLEFENDDGEEQDFDIDFLFCNNEKLCKDNEKSYVYFVIIVILVLCSNEYCLVF